MSIVTYNNRSIANISAIGAAKALTHIKTLTASSSSTLSFVDGSSDVVLDSTYPIYLFKFINIHPSASGEQLGFQGNAAGGSGYNETITSSVFQSFHREDDSSTALGYRTGDDQAQGTGFQIITNVIGDDADQSCSGTLHLFNPSSTTFIKHFFGRSANAHGSDYAQDIYYGGYCNVTAAIDAVQFKFSSGNIDSGVIKLYGIA